MTIEEYRQALAAATGHGWGFLAAYGLTWLVCSWCWRRWGARAGAYCTLFQGMVALPLGLLLTALTPGPARPEMEGMQGLSVLLSMGQLLGLPIVIYLVARGQFTRAPLAMVILLAVHFAPYSWLYATPLYLVMGGAISVCAAIADASARQGDAFADPDLVGAARVCLSTAVVMLASAGA
ncbi:MAG: hypothetical protein WA892_11395, partial [Ornithinimicrobium sp.]